jgi:Ras-related protein Rab-11A
VSKDEVEAMGGIIIKIAFVGDSNAWREDVCSKITDDYDKKTHSTIGVVTTVTDFYDISDYKIKFQIWDISSQKSFANVRINYYSGAKGAIIVFNANDRKSINNLTKWAKELRETVKDIPIFLINYLGDEKKRKTIKNKVIIRKLSRKIKEKLPIYEIVKPEKTEIEKIIKALGKKIIGI